MSIRVMNSVWHSAPYSEGTLLVLLALADWANDEGLCWPKTETIGIKARLTRSGVKYCMKKLIDDGAIKIESKSAGPGKPRMVRLSGQYLTPMGSVNGQKGVSNRTCNKEEPSLNHQNLKACSLCNGTGVLASFLQPGRIRDCECVQ